MLEKETNLLFQSLVNHHSINETTNIISKDIFDNPVMVTNAYFHVLAMSSDVEFEDSVWDYAVKNSCCSLESIEVFRDDQASKRLFYQPHSFIYNTNLGEHIPRILGRIEQQDIVYGYLIVFQVKHPLTDLDVQRADLVCQSLGVSLSSSQNESLSNNHKEYLFKELLSHKGNQVEIENELIQMQHELKPVLKVVAIKYDKAYSSFICNEINSKQANVTCFVYNNQIIVVCNYCDEQEIQSALHQISTICKKYSLIYGMSRRFHNPLELPTYLKQAVHARDIGFLIDHDKICFAYSKYQYYELLMNHSAEEIDAMICTEYRILKEYDQKEESELLLTALSYYKNAFNSALTTEELHIHRNTLSYRLHQIVDLLHQSVQDVDLMNNIYHSSLMDHWLQITKV